MLKIFIYILKTPKVVFSISLLKAAAKLKPNIFLVSFGSIMPSSHNLKTKQFYG